MERDARLQSLFYITFICLSKSRVHESPSRFLNGAPMESNAPHQRFLYITFRVPSKGAPPPSSPHRAPIERYAPFPEPSFNYLSEFWANRPRHLSGAPMERDACLQSLLLKSPVDEHPAPQRVPHRE